MAAISGNARHSMPKKPHPAQPSSPAHGTRNPMPIGELLRPLQHIIRQPDRNRLLADFFKE